jgi:hypothetical protein
VASANRRSEKKIEGVLGEDQFGFRKGTRDAIGMLRIISERTLDIDGEICICYIDCQKAFDCVKWTKLMKILKKTGIDWHERSLISKLYMHQSVEVWLDQGVTKSEEELDKDAVCYHFYSTDIVNTLPRKFLKVLETSM